MRRSFKFVCKFQVFAKKEKKKEKRKDNTKNYTPSSLCFGKPLMIRDLILLMKCVLTGVEDTSVILLSRWMHKALQQLYMDLWTPVSKFCHMVLMQLRIFSCSQLSPLRGSSTFSCVRERENEINMRLNEILDNMMELIIWACILVNTIVF